MDSKITQKKARSSPLPIGGWEKGKKSRYFNREAQEGGPTHDSGWGGKNPEYIGFLKEGFI